MTLPLFSLPIMAVTGKFDLSKLKKGKKENWLDKHLQEVTKGSVAKEMAIGGVSGWYAFSFFLKFL